MRSPMGGAHGCEYGRSMGVVGDHMADAHGHLHGCSYGAYTMMSVFIVGTGVLLIVRSWPSYGCSAGHHVLSATTFA